MRMSDLVAKYITEMLDEQNGSAEIQRNESSRKSWLCAKSDKLCYHLTLYPRTRLHCREQTRRRRLHKNKPCKYG